MRTAFFAGSVSLIANLFILSGFIPLAIGFRLAIILQITFWTFFTAIGATFTMFLLQKHIAAPIRPFVLLGCVVFLLSLIPIYVRIGILRDFPSSLVAVAVYALIAMHVTDSFLMSGFVIRLMR